MLVLHASFGPDDQLVVWAELRPRDVRRAGAPRRDGWHPGAAPAALLEGLPGEAVEAVLELPTRGDLPLPSPDLQRLDETATGGDDGEAAALGRWRVAGRAMPPGALVDVLAEWRDATGVVAGTGLRALHELARHAAGCVVRQEFLPRTRFVRAADGEATLEGRWSPVVRGRAGDELDRLLRSLPPILDAASPTLDLDAARIPLAARGARFVAAVVDDLVRTRIATDPPPLVATTPSRAESLHDRWLRALVSDAPGIDGSADSLDRLAADVEEWQSRLRRRAESPWRLLLRVEEPDESPADGDEDDETWTLRYLVQLRSDPTVQVPAGQAWSPGGADRTVLDAHDFHPGAHLLAPLAEVAAAFEPVAGTLSQPQPTCCLLTTREAHRFVAEVVPLLEPDSVAVAVPRWWSAGRARVSLRAQVVTELHGGRQHMDSLNLATLVGYDWRAAIGDAPLSREELSRLAAQKSELVRVRGRWVQLDRRELQAVLDHLERTADAPRTASIADLARMAAGAAATVEGLPVSGVDGVGDVAELLGRVRRGEPLELPDAPDGLRATLRPYQLRGFQWLVSMGDLGLGACLADDMGLGKTVQVLATIQHGRERAAACGDAHRPTLVACPTSVLTTWHREALRFTPELPVLVHHGGGRARGRDVVAAAEAHAVVLTSYAVLARDVDHLGEVDWACVVLDEAQQVKNPGTRPARAARTLRAPARIALTGTPVENHAGDLWSIMEFLNPGLLGSQADFRRKYLVPIQTGTFPEAAARLRQVVAPFLLRREKVDPSVIDDLPDKLEHVAWCHLTTEQASLYEAIVREAETTLRMSPGDARRSGIERRGLILATIARLKQACNHPAQLLRDRSAVAGRSGKLQRLDLLLEAVLDAGERALVFTQFVAMGELLQRHLRERLGRDVPFLHGGTSRADRDRMVERFQSSDDDAPPILLLSLKAGGSGLNLTAANHVVHYDRWWNPATEQQATDRVFRIGQARDVQVHALVCSGTVEERIDHMLRQKRGVAATLVGSGEQWVTELGDDELLDLFALRRDTMLQEGRLDQLDPKEWRRASP